MAQTEGTSLDTQADVCREYAATRGWTVVETYVEGGVSGSAKHRPGLERLMADAEAGRLDAVIVAKLDRFGRSLAHTATLIERLDELGLLFASVAEAVDDTPAGRFQRNVLLSVAEFERERIRERTWSGIERNALEGVWPNGRVPFGWRLTRDERKRPTVVIDRAAAEVWQRIAEGLIDRALSTLSLARELNAAGIRTPKGRAWSAGSLRQLVTEAHALDGTWVYRREGRPWSKGGDGPPIPISLPPILSTERFKALKAAIARSSRTRKTIRTLSLLSGRLTSPCGSAMWVMTKHSGQRYYRCARKFAADGGGAARSPEACGCHNVDASSVEEHVWGLVARALSDPEALISLAAEQSAAAAASAGVSAKDVAALDRRIIRLEKAASSALAEALVHGVDMAVAAGAVRAIQAELEEARDHRSQVAVWAASSEELARRATTLGQIASEITSALSLRPFADAHRRVLDALDVMVKIDDWIDCSSCGGSGRATGAGRGRGCTACAGHGCFPILRVSGHLPHLAITEPPWPVTLAETSA